MSTQFGLDLRLARRKSGFTQSDVARLIDSHQSTIAALENGKWLPSIEQICLFSLIFGRSFESLFAVLLENGRAKLRGNLASLPAATTALAMTQNRDVSIQKLERRLEANPADYDAD